MSYLAAYGIAAGFALVVLAISLAARRPIQRRWFAGTGFEEWRAVASGLPWRDRRALYRSTTRGRAAPPRLALLAVRRGEVMSAALARMSERTGAFRVLRIVTMAILAASVVIDVVTVALDPHDGSGWLSLCAALFALTFLALHGPLLRRQLRRTQRSIRLNRALIEQ
jgi:hypothetical protein